MTWCSRPSRAASAAFVRAAGEPGSGAFSLLDYPRGHSTGLITYEAHPSRALVRLPLRDGAPDVVVQTAAGRPVDAAVVQTGGRRELLFVESFEANERKDYRIEAGRPAQAARAGVTVKSALLQNDPVKLEFDRQGQVTSLEFEGEGFGIERFLRAGITYAGKVLEVGSWTLAASVDAGVAGFKRHTGVLRLNGDRVVAFEREILLAAGLPYIYIRIRAEFPRTPDRGYATGKAQRLQQAWDNDWQEIRPCEIAPALAGQPGSPLRVWKHNYCDHMSNFSLDYGCFSENVELDSVNNQVTHGWVAVSDGQRGLLVGQSADAASGMAFCPLRTRRTAEGMRVRFNPFGTYWGRQYRYGIADTGLGNLLATTFSASDHVNSYAPSYNGRVQEFSLLVAPYRGDAPPEAVRFAAEAFAYPYLVLDDDRYIAAPAHRSWDGAGLGEPPPPAS